MNIQMEEMSRAKYVGRGMKLLCPLCMSQPSSISICLPIQKLFEPPPFHVCVESLLHSDTPSLIPFAALLSSQENGEQAENDKLLIMARFSRRLVLIQEPLRDPPRATLEGKTLSPMSAFLSRSSLNTVSFQDSLTTPSRSHHSCLKCLQHVMSYVTSTRVSTVSATLPPVLQLLLYESYFSHQTKT